MARKFLVLMLVLLPVVAATAQAAPQKKSHKTKAPVVQPAPQPAPTPPPPPLTPEQGPAYPPEVSFKGGELTIVARNSTMGDVLTAVKQRTGAAVDMPAVSSERVVGRFGPGSPRDVMAQLLNGSHYDYVLMGSPADPAALKKIVLMARASGPDQPAPQPGNRRQNLQAVPDIANEEQPEDNGGEAAPDAQEEPQPEQPEQEQPAQDQPGQDQPAQNGPVVKTPEQLLRELQQQQQQQQQNGTPPDTPPQ